MTIWDRLEGYKTYIAALFMVMAAFAKFYGYIDQDIYEVLMSLLAAAGFGFLRAGVKRGSQC